MYVHSVVSDSAIPWTVAHQAPLPMKFSKQEYWSGLPFSSPGDLSDPGTEPGSPTSLHWQVVPLPLNHQGSPLIHPRLLQINSYCYQSPWPLFTDQHFFFSGKHEMHVKSLAGRQKLASSFYLKSFLHSWFSEVYKRGRS